MRFASPAASRGQFVPYFGFAGGVRLLHDLLFRVASARQWRQRRRGIILLGLPLAPLASHSGVNGEAGEEVGICLWIPCTGFRGRCVIDFDS